MKTDGKKVGGGGGGEGTFELEKFGGFSKVWLTRSYLAMLD